MKNPLLDIVVPSYNEEKTIPIFYAEILKILPLLPYQDIEFLFVDDGSCDNTLTVIKELASKDKRVKYISFSRNFGKESAIYAGLQHAKGDFVVVMDADLQDPPNLLPEMYNTLLKGEYDAVATRRVTRSGEPPIRSFFARMFYQLFNKMSKIELVDGARDYRFMTQRFVNAILTMKEYNRFSKGLFSWVGLKQKWLEFENVERVAGETKWSFLSLLKYAMLGITSFTTFPLQISTFAGIVFLILSLFTLLFWVIKAFITKHFFGRFTIIIATMLFVGGTILVSLGIIGQYLSQIFTEVKSRPIYIIGDANIAEQGKQG